MGGNHGRHLCVVHSQAGIRYPLQDSSLSHNEASLLPSKRHQSHLYATGSSRGIIGKEGSGDRGRSDFPRLLQSYFSGTEKERQVQAGDRLVNAQQEYRTGTLQNGDTENCASSYTQRFLDSLHRPAGCLPARSHPAIVQEVSQVYLEQQGVPVL